MLQSVEDRQGQEEGVTRGGSGGKSWDCLPLPALGSLTSGTLHSRNACYSLKLLSSMDCDCGVLCATFMHWPGSTKRTMLAREVRLRWRACTLRLLVLCLAFFLCTHFMAELRRKSWPQGDLLLKVQPREPGIFIEGHDRRAEEVPSKRQVIYVRRSSRGGGNSNVPKRDNLKVSDNSYTLQIYYSIIQNDQTRNQLNPSDWFRRSFNEIWLNRVIQPGWKINDQINYHLASVCRTDLVNNFIAFRLIGLWGCLVEKERWSITYR